MTRLLLLLVFLFLQGQWTAGRSAAAGCPQRQSQVGGRCCNFCPPGTHVKQLCTENSQTVCAKCANGFLSLNHTMFDRCDPCRVCPQGYVAHCTSTADAKCRCWAGFQCTDHVCSMCQKEPQCMTGERVVRTGSTVYSYACKPACPADKYWDAGAKVCRPFTQCHKVGLVERFPGNRTRDAVCAKAESDPDGGVFQVAFVICVILLLLAFLAGLSYFCASVLRKHKAASGVKAAQSPAAANTCTCEYHLSKEETGLQLIIQDVSKFSDSSSQMETCTVY